MNEKCLLITLSAYKMFFIICDTSSREFTTFHIPIFMLKHPAIISHHMDIRSFLITFYHHPENLKNFNNLYCCSWMPNTFLVTRWITKNVIIPKTKVNKLTIQSNLHNFTFSVHQKSLIVAV